MLNSMYSIIVNALQTVLMWFVDLFKGHLFGLLGTWLKAQAVTWLPADWSQAATGLVDYMQVANAWLPVDWALMLFFAYFAIAVAFSTLKITVKLIPFVG